MKLYRRNDSPFWYADYTLPNGRRIKRSTKTNSQQEAKALLQKWLSGSVPTKGSQESIDDLISEYANFCDASPDHQQYVQFTLGRVFGHVGRPGQITEYDVERVIRGLVNSRNGQPASKRTKNYYLTEAKAFTKWLVRKKKLLDTDPLQAIDKLRERESDLTRNRRYLTPEEWTWLAKTPHALLYETAIQTGYRASELWSLTAQSLSITDCTLSLSAVHTKDGQKARQCITRRLAERLEGYFPLRDHLRSSFPKWASRILKEDLGIARWRAANDGCLKPQMLVYKNDFGEHLDFHALRHTCGAWLAMDGVYPKTVQAVMRHKSIKLTLDTYGHLFPGAIEQAIAKFDARF